jgi:hypothetical protein
MNPEGVLSGRLAAELGEEDARRLAELAISPETFRVDVHALSEANNPEGEQNRMIAVSQMTANYYSFVTRMLSLVENPQTQGAPGLRARVYAIVAYTHLHAVPRIE